MTADTIPALLAARQRTDGAMRAIVTEQDAITYAALDDESAALASRLVAAGVAKGDRVGLLAPNGIDWAVHAMAVLRIGAILVPLSTLLRPPELRAQLTTAEVSHLVAVETFRDRHYLDDLEVAASGLELRAIWQLGDVPGEAAPRDVVATMEAEVTATDDLSVLFTSGSQGAPKGVIHTHGAALRAVAVGLAARCVHPGERLYIPMPFFWTGGFSGGLLTALVGGATLLTEAEPEPSRTLALLERERATLFRGWPDQAARLAADPAFAATDLASLGDGSLPAVLPADRRPAPGARPNLFGMTETFGPYCGERLDRDLPASKHGSCGRPFDGVEVRIADPDTGDEVPADEPGEIWLQGPNLLRGICGRPRESVFTPDGWFRTGDLGRLDADGYLWYAGRLDDMVKVRGATVYPIEVEAALRALPDVRAAHVTDVARDDGTVEVGALVVTELDPDAVRAAVRERLSAFKVPTRWWTTSDASEVPMLASGKVDKVVLRRVLATQGRPERSTS
jgi:acyl-CoA synthetase (AMP-forming)/AMP-acid ligase II